MKAFSNFLKNNQFTLLGLVVAGVITWLISTLLGWMLSIFGDPVLQFMLFRIEVPIFALLISLILTLLLARTYRTRKIKRNKLRIKDAKYGANGVHVDITRELNLRVEGDKLRVLIDNTLAGDPLESIVKQAEVFYSLNGKDYRSIVDEGQVLDIH